MTVPLDDEGRHDLDAMARGGDRGDAASCSSAIRTTRPRRRFRSSEIEAFVGVDAAPRLRDRRRGLHRVLDARRTPTSRSRCSRATRTPCCCGRSRRSTGCAGCASATRSASEEFRLAVDRVRQPFSVNALAQAAAVEALRHQDEVASRVERTAIERFFIEDELRQRGLDRPTARRTSRGSRSATTTRTR